VGSIPGLVTGVIVGVSGGPAYLTGLGDALVKLDRWGRELPRQHRGRLSGWRESRPRAEPETVALLRRPLQLWRSKGRRPWSHFRSELT